MEATIIGIIIGIIVSVIFILYIELQLRHKAAKKNTLYYIYCVDKVIHLCAQDKMDMEKINKGVEEAKEAFNKIKW